MYYLFSKCIPLLFIISPENTRLESGPPLQYLNNKRHEKNLSSASGQAELIALHFVKNMGHCPRPVTKHRLFSYSVQYSTYTTRIQKDSPMPQGIPVFCSPATDEIHSLLAPWFIVVPPPTPHQREIKRLENWRRQDLVYRMRPKAGWNSVWGYRS